MSMQHRTIVGVDMRPTEEGFKAHFGRGTGRYASELMVALDELSAHDSSISVVKVGSNQITPTCLEKRFLSMLPAGKKTIEYQFLAPRRYKHVQVDMMHFLAHGDAAMWCAKPYIVTVLDLIPLKFPELYKASRPSWRFKFARFLEASAVRHAKGIIAISEATKRDVIEFLDVPEDRIHVVPLAANGKFYPRPVGEDCNVIKEAARNKLGLCANKRMLLYVGGIDARKNIPFLLQVVDELRRCDDLSDVLLLMAGNYTHDDHFEALLDEIHKLHLDDVVRMLGFVPDENLLSLYHAADVVVFPSLYEGFGLPVLEAMASGVCVVAGNNSSLPEVVGNASPLLPDKDVSAWVSKLYEILMNEDVKQTIANNGIHRAKVFSWANTARQTFNVYESLAV